jgi:hypothetical protein
MELQGVRRDEPRTGTRFLVTVVVPQPDRFRDLTAVRLRRGQDVAGDDRPEPAAAVSRYKTARCASARE